jgi:ACS family allantoate permease-like MFS transporter
MSDIKPSLDEKAQPFAALDGRRASVSTGQHQVITVGSLADADEALTFLENHPRAAEIAEEGNAILEDERSRRRLVRKIDLTIAPLLAMTYFLQVSWYLCTMLRLWSVRRTPTALCYHPSAWTRTKTR